MWTGTVPARSPSYTFSSPPPRVAQCGPFCGHIPGHTAPLGGGDLERYGLEGRARQLVGVDVVGVRQCDRDVVEALEQAPARVVVDIERVRNPIRALSRAHRALGEVNGDLGAGLVFDEVPDRSNEFLVYLRREQPGLTGVAAKDIAEARRDDGLEAVVLERPYSVFA